MILKSVNIESSKELKMCLRLICFVQIIFFVFKKSEATVTSNVSFNCIRFAMFSVLYFVLVATEFLPTGNVNVFRFSFRSVFVFFRCRGSEWENYSVRVLVCSTRETNQDESSILPHVA